jgi:hypothetical protein
MKAVDFIRPGDCLLYRASGVVGWIIKIKTWHDVTHCEGYAGAGMSVASRGPQDGVGGVGLYPLRLDGLVAILRPIPAFNLARAMAWFRTVNGESYDLWGLLRFFTIGAGKQDRMFCSEFLTRWYRAGGFEPFQPDEDADAVPPCYFLISPLMDHHTVDSTGEVTYVDNPQQMAG